MPLARCVDMQATFSKLHETIWRERHFICFAGFRLIAEMSSALSAVFLFGWAFVCFVLAWLFSIWLFYSVLESLIKQTLPATNAVAVQACVIILCSFLCRWLQNVTKQQREIASFCIFERMLIIRRPIFTSFFSNFDAVLHILFGIFLTA